MIYIYLTFDINMFFVLRFYILKKIQINIMWIDHKDQTNGTTNNEFLFAPTIRPAHIQPLRLGDSFGSMWLYHDRSNSGNEASATRSDWVARSADIIRRQII